MMSSVAEQAVSRSYAFPLMPGRGPEASNADVPVVFVVDDDGAVRHSLELLIQSVGWRVETFTSAPAFLSRPHAGVPCCLVLDAMLPGVNGLQLQKQLVDRTEMPIVFITEYVDVSTTVQAMKAGAIEFLTKPLDDRILLAAIREAMERSREVMGRNAKLQALRDCYGSLTRRERDVMALVVSGLLNKQVAGELGITEVTVKAHRGQVMRKMRADSLPDLVRMAARLGSQATRIISSSQR
jgi:FixJ family two-component response regulator